MTITKTQINNEGELLKILLYDYYDENTYIIELSSDAMYRSANEIAKEWGFKSYEKAYEKLNWETYRHEFLTDVMSNASIDTELLNNCINQLLEEYDITFEINLHQYLYEQAVNNFEGWE